MTKSKWFHRLYLPALLSISLLTAFLHASPAPEERADVLKTPALLKALTTLEKNEYATELAWWAADERGGREPGTPGNIQAGNSAAEQFSKLGLTPVGDLIDGKPSYFQYLPRGGKRGFIEDPLLAVGGKKFEYEKDWSLLGGCDKVDLNGVDVVFAGYGITAPEHEYDDYKGIDVEGKAVLIFRHEPREEDMNSGWKGAGNTNHSYFQTKLDHAKKHGALALLFVNGPLHHDPEKDPLSGLSTSVGRNETVPMIHIRKSVADQLLNRSGLDLLELQKKIDKQVKPASKRLSGTRIDLKAEIGDVAKARNVMAFLEGSDPRLKDEVVVIGAHYDHLGLGAYGSRARDRQGEVHNGADDNASGSLGVIELAEAIVQGGLRPKRSVLFQLYDAEEKGLIGSRHYVDNPVIPLEKTSAMINMDMIARVSNNRCGISGTGSGEEWEDILKIAETGSSVTFNHSAGGSGGSDHASFMRKNIPVLFFFSGMHPEYHTPDDDVELCNMEGAVEVLKVALKTTMLVTDRDGRLTFKQPPASARGRGRPKFGISTKQLEGDEAGVQITAVASGSGAEKAGLHAGDILLTVNGKPIKSFMDLYGIVRTLEPGETVNIRFRRGDEENEVEVVYGSL